MDYIVVAFRSREQTLKFSSFLSARGLPNAVINTPKEAGVGCGLSVKIPVAYFSTVKQGIKNLRPNSFAGYFAVSDRGGKRSVRSI